MVTMKHCNYTFMNCWILGLSLGRRLHRWGNLRNIFCKWCVSHIHVSLKEGVLWYISKYWGYGDVIRATRSGDVIARMLLGIFWKPGNFGTTSNPPTALRIASGRITHSHIHFQICLSMMYDRVAISLTSCPQHVWVKFGQIKSDRTTNKNHWCVCVCNIWIDVKLLFFLFLSFSRGLAAIMQTHASEAMHGWWKPGLITLVYLDFCDYLLFRVCFHSYSIILQSVRVSGEGAKPRTPKQSFLFRWYFTRGPCDTFWNGEGLSQELYRDHCHGLRFIWRYLFDGIYGRDCLLGVPSIGRLIHLGLLFFWPICTFKDSVPDGSLKKIQFCLVWFLRWLRHGAIGPLEATPLWVNVDWPDFGSDSDTFDLAFPLRNVQQLAFRFPAFLRCPAGPVVPWEPW